MPVEQMMTLKALRTRMGLKQTDVAETLGIHKDTLSSWERDASEMPVKYMYEFENLYKYPLNGIFFGNSIALSESLKSGDQLI